MPNSRKKCICQSEFCQNNGSVGEARVPRGRRQQFQQALGLENELTQPDLRVWLGHFAADDLEASKQGSGAGGTEVTVRLKDGALPTQTDVEMAEASRGALSQLRRSQAVCDRHRAALLEACTKQQEQDTKIRDLQDRVQALEEELTTLGVGLEKKQGDLKACAPWRASRGIDSSILQGLCEDSCRSLCGLSSAESLDDLWRFLDYRGRAQSMNFYNADKEQASGLKDDGRRIERRSKKLGGTNGLFFALFVMRTSTSLRVASTLFDVSESTGGRAFTAWLDLLGGCSRALVRLPDVNSVVASAPPNYRRRGLSSVAVVLDGTEVWVDKVWQTDAQHALWSPYKKTYTAKLLIGVTPAGAICYVSDAYAGRISDVELVKASGIIDDLERGGFGGKGMHVMADRGFNAMAPILINIGMHYVAPPSKRRGEDQFTEEDAGITRDVANLRIHVERAIGAIKQWRILDTKFDSQQMDNIGPIALVCAALVNLTRKPFACTT
ncbi:unnamed protein product [Pylaiella littoralis]